MFNSEEEQPRAKKRKEEAERSLESCLTDDLVLNCVARVSRSDLATLSLASKSYRSLVASPDLYKIRSLIGRTETHIYVCVRTPGPDPTLGWYILRRSETSSGLIPIPSSSSSALPLEGSSVVVLDWGIYVIGGFIITKGEEKRTGNVWLLDCRTHTWRRVPSMGVGRAYGAAGVVDGKIYVFGGYDVVDDHWGQVFDPKTQTWDTLPMPKVNNKNIHDSFVRDHKVYAVDGMDRTYYYSPREGKWGSGNRGEQKGSRRDWCMVDNLIYCLSRNGTVFWCEPDELDLLRGEEMMNTKEVKGLGSSLKTSLLLSRVVHVGDQILHRWEQTKIRNGHPPNKKSKLGRIGELEDLIPGARLINSGGGNIVLFWDHLSMDSLEIWCAEISLERRQGDEIWGKTEWSSVVMTFEPWPNHYKEQIPIGSAEVRATFSSGSGRVGGCMGNEGEFVKDCGIRVLRKGKTVHVGVLDSLKRVKENVKECQSGFVPRGKLVYSEFNVDDITTGGSRGSRYGLDINHGYASSSCVVDDGYASSTDNDSTAFNLRVFVEFLNESVLLSDLVGFFRMLLLIRLSICSSKDLTVNPELRSRRRAAGGDVAMIDVQAVPGAAGAAGGDVIDMEFGVTGLSTRDEAAPTLQNLVNGQVAIDHVRVTLEAALQGDDEELIKSITAFAKDLLKEA
uniref:F-box domain-containing protein n=1 Tax=Brassica campestris TaxID=3711 RepID=M4DJA4_BRACM